MLQVVIVLLIFKGHCLSVNKNCIMKYYLKNPSINVF